MGGWGTVKRGMPFALGVPALIWQVLFFYLPLLFMFASSVLKMSPVRKVVGLTGDHFRFIALSKVHFIIIADSLLLAFFSAVLCLGLAFPMARFIASRDRYRTVWVFFLIVPFWTNFLLHVYAWFFVLEKEGLLNNALSALRLISEPIRFLNSPFAVLLMMVYCYLPFVVLPLLSSLERLDKNLLEASEDLGASDRQTLLKVIVPLTAPAIRTSFFLVFIPAFGEFIIPELMGGDKLFFVGNVISHYMLHAETEGIGTAFMSIATLALATVSAVLYRMFEGIYGRFMWSR
ncbi:MAG: ABC transporter permease [Simkaniaceae bacterium]|nr:ABC transporter permease [Simkaniaceae bacterium]